MIYVSGAEPAPFRVLGMSTNLPEEYGVDFLWATDGGLVGVQRKKFPSDLLSSMHDGRLGKELAQMEALAQRAIILEGEPVFTEDGELMFGYGARNFNRDTLINLQFSLQQNHGVAVLWSEDHADTIRVIQSLYTYTLKNKASSLSARGVGNKRWGRADSAEYAAYLLESVPGVGLATARRIVDALGGKLPVRWLGTRDELLAIVGVGPKTADAIIAAFGGEG